VALLRGLNVGGRNVLPMEELKGLFADAGCADVRTYIQSGNVLFTATAALARRLPRLLSEAIATGFGHQVPVVVRSADELREVATRNPFPEAAAAPKRLHVAFLAEAPTPAAVKALDPARSPPDAFVVRGREVYLSLPNGVAGTRLTNDYLDRTLATVSTLRNWRTVKELVALLDG
jgi:uncharacterized protein (DUF1697 family)